MLLILAVLGGFLFLTTTNTSTNKEGFFLDEYHLKYPTSTSFFELQKDSVSTNDIINQITSTITPLEVEVINLGTNNVMIDRIVTDTTINGGSSFTISIQWKRIIIQKIATNTWIVY